MYFHKLQACRAEEEEDHPELKAKIPDTREEDTLPAEHRPTPRYYSDST